VEETFIGHYSIPHVVCDNMRFIWHSLKDRQTDGLVGNQQVKKNVKDSTDINFQANEFSGFDPYIPLIINFAQQYVDKYIGDITVGKFGIEEFNIQHYNPGGGFKKWHFERTSSYNARRFLTFMTYLTDTPNGGTEFKYQNKTFECVKGDTLIWPSDFTHIHRGVISQEHDKMIATGWIVFYDEEDDSVIEV
jgi:hypothetical protein